jgi:hypothetical protein
MTRLALGLIILMLGQFLSLEAAAGGAPSSGLVPSGYRMVWDDEFNDLSLSDTFPTAARWLAHFGKWSVRYLSANGDDGIKLVDDTVLRSGRTVAEALRPASPRRGGFLHEVSDGTLKLRAYPLSEAMRSEFWDHRYVASMISGEPSFAQRYGYWEARLRLNTIGKGQHFTLWLLAIDGVWPPEIDILEVVGDKPHLFSANVNNAPMKFYEEPKTRDGFHVFGLLRTPDMVRWTVDGDVIRETTDLIGDKALYLLASWETGSTRPNEAPDSSTPWPAEAEIDYVRIYAPPSQPQ